MDEIIVVVVGRGILGISTAIELKNRGYKVISVAEKNRNASTEDVSKITRGDYGDDILYTKLHLSALDKWKQKEKEWNRSDLFHWTGVSLLSRDTVLSSDSYEYACIQTFQKIFPGNKEGIVFTNEKMIQDSVNPVLRSFKTGLYNPVGGWIESGKVLQCLIDEAVSLGVEFIYQNCTRVTKGQVYLQNGEIIKCDKIIVAAGAWTPFLLPETSKLLKACGQPVFHFEPKHERFSKPWKERSSGEGLMTPITLDMGKTGFYCFPFHPTEKILKVGHHGEGKPITSPMTTKLLLNLAATIRNEEESRFLEFMNEITINFSNEWKVKDFIICQYCDSFDSHFLIDQVNDGVYVAAGGSGHGFKFGLVIGQIAADVIEGKQSNDSVLREARERFKWRNPSSTVSFEKARYVEPPISKL